MIAPAGTLTDTGPLFALADPKGQPKLNARCEALLSSLPIPLFTTWPFFIEALYLCGKRGAWPMQSLLWDLWHAGSLRIYNLTENESARMAVLMEQYRDRPMDAADASLIAVAETYGHTQVFSVDSDFYVYRLADGTALEVAPGSLPM